MLKDSSLKIDEIAKRLMAKRVDCGRAIDTLQAVKSAFDLVKHGDELLELKAEFDAAEFVLKALDDTIADCDGMEPEEHVLALAALTVSAKIEELTETIDRRSTLKPVRREVAEMLVFEFQRILKEIDELVEAPAR